MSHLVQIYTKHREVWSYLFFGVLTTLINYIVYFVCLLAFHMHYATSNLIAWILAVLFAFITNKQYVFNSKNWDFHTTLRECWQFISARILSVIIETALLWLFIDFFICDERIVKIFTNIIVVLINYILSKYVIFKLQT
ncbi:MAG: GtrA family protein [Desulfovibrionaceae bacterium]|nr:GtrA family protein [Desulfovibrionaceae bacterium]